MGTRTSEDVGVKNSLKILFMIGHRYCCWCRRCRCHAPVPFLLVLYYPIPPLSFVSYPMSVLLQPLLWVLAQRRTLVEFSSQAIWSAAIAGGREGLRKWKDPSLYFPSPSHQSHRQAMSGCLSVFWHCMTMQRSSAIVHASFWDLNSVCVFLGDAKMKQAAIDSAAYCVLVIVPSLISCGVRLTSGGKG